MNDAETKSTEVNNAKIIDAVANTAEMGNANKYKAAFSRIRTSVIIDLEDYHAMKKPRYLYKKRIAFAVAVICLIAALSTAALAAGYWFGLRDLALPTDTAPPASTGADSPDIQNPSNPSDSTSSPDPQDPSGNPPVTENPHGPARISLQGYAGSPECKALVEWTDFLAGYDQDGSILAAIGSGDTGLDYTYFLYGCYTQEMADKLDEIAGKYALSLHGGMTFYANVDELMGAIADRRFLGDGISAYPGYVYEDGTFQFPGGFVVFDPNYGGSGAYGLMPLEMRRCPKGTMDYVALGIGSFDDYTEWVYETDCGVTVCLAQSAYKSLIIAELDNAFVTVNVLVDMPHNRIAMPASALEALADAIDFTALK